MFLTNSLWRTFRVFHLLSLVVKFYASYGAQTDYTGMLPYQQAFYQYNSARDSSENTFLRHEKKIVADSPPGRTNKKNTVLRTP